MIIWLHGWALQLPHFMPNVAMLASDSADISRDAVNTSGDVRNALCLLALKVI
jgi:hypothetical protein